MCEQGFGGCLRVFYECSHLALCITLGKKRDVYASRGIGCLHERGVRCHVAEAYVTDQNVRWHNGVCERCRRLASVGAQVNGHVNGVFWHGHKKHVLKRAVCRLCLVVGKPFLKEGGERVAVDNALCLMVAHGYLSVSLHRQLFQMIVLAVPSWHEVKLVNIDVLS